MSFTPESETEHGSSVLLRVQVEAKEAVRSPRIVSPLRLILGTSNLVNCIMTMESVQPCAHPTTLNHDVSFPPEGIPFDLVVEEALFGVVPRTAMRLIAVLVVAFVFAWFVLLPRVKQDLYLE
jgi:hypothetical protein